jgi:hypothetical protein
MRGVNGHACCAYPVGNSPRHLAASDFNGDGKPDLAVANNGANNLSVLLGTGGGVFAPATSYSAGSDVRSVITGDFNGDGKLDVAIGGRDVNVLLISILLQTACLP